MKIIREYINEKFVEDSDPIKDMGIGTITFENIKKGDIIIRTKGNIKFKNIRIDDYCLVNKVQRAKNTLILWLTMFTSPTSLKYYRKQIFLDYPQLKYDGVFYAEPYRSWEKCFKVLQPKELQQFESVNEKFEEHSDPIKDLNIGITYDKIVKWVHDNVDPKSQWQYEDFLFICCALDRLDFAQFLLENYDYSLKELNQVYRDLKSQQNDSCEKGAKFIRTYIHKWHIGESLNEKFVKDSDPIKDMKIGIDYTSIMGFLKTMGYTDIKIEKRTWNMSRLPRVYVTFSNDETDFEFEIVLDYDTASWRHQLKRTDRADDRSFDYQEPRWTYGDKKGEIDDEAFIVSIIRRRLNKYNKNKKQ